MHRKLQPVGIWKDVKESSQQARFLKTIFKYVISPLEKENNNNKKECISGDGQYKPAEWSTATQALSFLKQ